MRYREYAPSPALAPHVRCYWLLEGCSHAPEVVFPDGCMELVCNFADSFEQLHSTGSTPQPQSFLVGQMLRPTWIRPRGAAGVFGVRFLPGGARAFLPFPQQDATGRLLSLDLLCGAAAREFEDHIASARRDHQRIAAVERFLLDRMREIDRIPDWLSARQYRRRFEDAVGLTPKSFARVRRFQQALRRLPAQPPAEVAAACGYFDQSHFTHDFREFTGMTPGEYLRHLAAPQCPFSPILDGAGPPTIER